MLCSGSDRKCSLVMVYSFFAVGPLYSHHFKEMVLVGITKQVFAGISCEAFKI